MNSSSLTASLFSLTSLLTAGCSVELGAADLGSGSTPGLGDTGGGGQAAGGSDGATGGASSGGSGLSSGGGVAVGGTGFGAGGTVSASGGGGSDGFSSGGTLGGGGLFGVGGFVASGGAAAGGSGTGGSGIGGAVSGTGGDGAGGMMALTTEEFFTEMCSECHGPTGDGVSGKGPDIKHPVVDYSTFVIRSGRGPAEDISGKFSQLYEEAMPSFATAVLPDAMLADVLAFLSDQPQPTTGEGLYQDYCAACHGDDARGGMTTRSLKNESGKVMQLIRSGKNVAQFAQRRDCMPKWTTAELTDAEGQLIISYLNTLP